MRKFCYVEYAFSKYYNICTTLSNRNHCQTSLTCLKERRRGDQGNPRPAHWPVNNVQSGDGETLSGNLDISRNYLQIEIDR